jgi:SAM-dependent methyltransferase
MSVKEKFIEIYENNLWGSTESVSGSGSEIQNTKVIQNELPVLLQKFNIKSILDIPCGDWNWMKNVNLCGASYIGADIVEPLIKSNKINYPNIDFRVMDLINDPLPKVDLIFTRDCLGHLNNNNILKALKNCKESKSKYLLATSFTKWDINPDIEDGGWKCINLMIPPFQLNPIYLINEDCKEGYPHYNDKCMILFQLNYF